MPSLWGKSSSKDAKRKIKKQGFIDSIHRKFKNISIDRRSNKSRGSKTHNDTISEKGSAVTKSATSSTQVSRCQSFADRPVALPLPLPGSHSHNSSVNTSPKKDFGGNFRPLLFPPLAEDIPDAGNLRDAKSDLGIASVSSDSSVDSDDTQDQHPPGPRESDHGIKKKLAVKSPSSKRQKDRALFVAPISPEEKPKTFINSHLPPTSPKKRPPRAHVKHIQIPPYPGFSSAPDSSLSSPSKSPVRVLAKPSSHCSTPSSGQTSGHNSVGGDVPAQFFWPQSRCSPECSPIPSPRMTSPGPSSRTQSGAVTPLHPHTGGTTPEVCRTRTDDRKHHQGHRLPLPPITVPSSGPLSPGLAENSNSPVSRWKKGRPLGSGTFGDVYLGFNSETGEMCAMKEVTLFSDDSKSEESTKQLEQEIALLSRLHHPNIVQYYGSETVGDKLYIYLEYVSGGSIHKILREYGPLGESAIRSYTKQILSGLAYLHLKNTVHRDIKGANILVDPSGRIKLADFGMAKHITGPACPLSFKGSPYWMAPEVIRNSNGCNLAVDIWSLGCTIIEMATAKPPWSQYEGVAALFKIGNSKELPAFPDHLSEAGKDFVRQCLQRNPLHRPTALKLLKHPFIKAAGQMERPLPCPDLVNQPITASNVATEMGTRHARTVSSMDTEGESMNLPRRSNMISGKSEASMPRNISCPVSPLASPFLHRKSSPHPSGRMSPSINSPHSASGASSPYTGGNGAIPLHHLQQPTTCLHEVFGLQRPQKSPRTTGGLFIQDLNPERVQGVPQVSHAFKEMVSPENDLRRNQFGRAVAGKPRALDDGQLIFADRVSQQLLKDHVKLNPSFDINPDFLTQRHTRLV